VNKLRFLRSENKRAPIDSRARSWSRVWDKVAPLLLRRWIRGVDACRLVTIVAGGLAMGHGHNQFFRAGGLIRAAQSGESQIARSPQRKQRVGFDGQRTGDIA